MIYSRKEVNKKLDSLLKYSSEHQDSSMYSLMKSEIDKVKSAINSYLSKDKQEVSSLVESVIKTWLWYRDYRYQKCTNDDYLGINSPYVPVLYWENDWTLLTINGAFNFEDIMNTSDVDFNNAWHIEYPTTPGTSTGTTVRAVNTYIGYTDSSSVVHQGWISYINSKRDQEIKSLKQAISDMENFDYQVNEMVDMFEDRGELISSGTSVMVDSLEKEYYVCKRTINGDILEKRFGKNDTYSLALDSTIEGLASMIYLPEYYGVMNIIRCLELYNSADFDSSVPISTLGASKVYIPSYLKDAFKELLKRESV